MKLTDKSVIAASLNESKGILTKISPSLSKLPPSFPNEVWYWVNANQGRLETWFDLLGEVPGSEEFLVQQIEIHRSILNYFLTHLNEILDSAKKRVSASPLRLVGLMKIVVKLPLFWRLWLWKFRRFVRPTKTS